MPYPCHGWAVRVWVAAEQRLRLGLWLATDFQAGGVRVAGVVCSGWIIKS